VNEAPLSLFQVLQFCDFFFSILGLWVTLVALAGLDPQVVSALHMAGVVMIAMGVQYNRTGLLVFTVPLVLGIVILVRTLYAFGIVFVTKVPSN